MRLPARVLRPDHGQNWGHIQPVFQPRVPELRALEGWYQAPLYRFKVSCAFNDILRCSRTSHFNSCFRDKGEYSGREHGWGVREAAGVHYQQPLRRCYDPNWAIIYLPDKRGDFLGRCFLRLNYRHDFELGRIYGNNLTYTDIITAIPALRGCVTGVEDSYI